MTNGSVLVTDGNQLRRLEGNIVSAGGSRDFVGLVGTADGFWALTSAPAGSTGELIQITSGHVVNLPARFVPSSLGSLDTRVWVEGTVDGAPAVVLVDGTAVRSTVVLDGGPQRVVRMGE